MLIHKLTLMLSRLRRCPRSLASIKACYEDTERQLIYAISFIIAALIHECIHPQSRKRYKSKPVMDSLVKVICQLSATLKANH